MVKIILASGSGLVGHRRRVGLLLLLLVEGEEVGDGVVGHRLEDDWWLGLSGKDGLVFFVDVMGELQLSKLLLLPCS